MPFIHSPAFILGSVAASFGLVAVALKLAPISIGLYRF
jgi:hypothetical protein